MKFTWGFRVRWSRYTHTHTWNNFKPRTWFARRRLQVTRSGALFWVSSWSNNSWNSFKVTCIRVASRNKSTKLPIDVWCSSSHQSAFFEEKSQRGLLSIKQFSPCNQLMDFSRWAFLFYVNRQIHVRKLFWTEKIHDFILIFFLLELETLWSQWFSKHCICFAWSILKVFCLLLLQLSI